MSSKKSIYSRHVSVWGILTKLTARPLLNYKLKSYTLKVRDETFNQMSSVKPSSLNWYTNIFAKLDSPEMGGQYQSHLTSMSSCEDGWGMATKVQPRRQFLSRSGESKPCVEARIAPLNEYKGHSTYPNSGIFCKTWQQWAVASHPQSKLCIETF